MAKTRDIPDILGPARQQVSVLDDVLSGKPLGTWPKEVDYPIEKISIGKRLRPVKDVTELAASMKEQGLLQRIVLLPDGTLVVGGHRVAAAKLLGWTTIPARIAELDEVDAELAEIDENLYRRELTVLEQAEHLQRRMELLEIKGQRAKAGDNQHSEATTTAAVAESIGISERSAQQRLQIARGLSQAARDALRDTELAQSTTKLLELAKQPQEYQVKIVEKMVNDGYQSVEMAALAVMPRKVGPDPVLVAQGEETERRRLAYMEENGRRNEEHFAKMRESLAVAKAQPPAPEEPTISLDELEVVDSVTVRVDDGGKLMMDWDDDDWAAYKRKLEQRQSAQATKPELPAPPPPPPPYSYGSVPGMPSVIPSFTPAGSSDAALDVLAPDRNEVSSAAQKRNERIDSVLRRLYAAQAAASEFEELTGVYTHTPAFRRVMENMISVLEANRI